MSESSFESDFTSRVRAMQIIAVTLLTGVAVLAGVALFLQDEGPGEEVVDDRGTPVITYLAIFMSATAVVGRLVIPRLVISQKLSCLNKPETPEDESAQRATLVDFYQARMILQMALLEGAAFFALVAFIVEGQWAACGVAAALWVLMALSFPTSSSVEQWVIDQRRDIDARM